jgi:hypothetical protein
MRFPKKKAAALALALGVTGVLTTALPALAAAAVTSFTPVCGVVGTSVTITGTGFTSVTGVDFNGTAAVTFNTVNATTETATVPTGATTGPITVETAGVDTASSTSFTVVTAAAPTITSFAPVSGAIGSSVVITGTNFCGTTAVKFNTTNATSFTVNSATQITATVPVGATTGKITVTNTVGSVVSTADFTILTGIPTITSFSPTVGSVGRSVVITGTNFAGTTAVKFNGTTAVFTVNSATQITAPVPTGATTGPITVTNPLGTATSATNFTLVTKHTRSVSLTLKHHLIATGTVSVSDGFNACRSNVTVKIQRLKDGVWKTVGTDQTTGLGKYKKAISDKAGKYRALAKKEVLNGGADVCVKDISPTRNHH